MIRFMAALATAAAVTLSFPPFEQSYLAWVSLVPLLLATGGGGRRDFLLGWAAGTAATLGTVWWIVNTITHYGGIGWPLAVPIMVLLSLTVGLYWALFSWGRGLLQRRLPRLPALLVTPALWVLCEYLRAHTPEISFPWALLGYSQFRLTRLVQAADIFGVWGISFAIVFVNSAAAALLRPAAEGGRAFSRVAGAVAALLLLAGLWTYGGEQLSREPPGETVRVAVIQGNIPQELKWDAAERERIMAAYEDLSREAASGGVDLIAWPEAATPYYYQYEPDAQERIAALARETKAAILFGAPAVEGAGEERRLRNRAYLVQADGSPGGWYDKLRLVPFGEHVPWQRVLFFVSKLVDAVGEFSPGEAATVLRIPAGAFGTLVCYEVIFPELARRFTRRGARFFVNITNDAWFGRTAASLQHYSTLVFRAVENRAPFARAANTGISGFVDSQGRIREASALFVRGHYQGTLRLDGRPTLYVRWGDVLPQAAALFLLPLLAIALLRPPPKKTYRLPPL